MGGIKVKIFGPEGIQILSVKKTYLTIGQGSHCELRPPGNEVAEEHFRIWSDGGHLWGQDLGSPNGTFVNGQRLQPLRALLFRHTDLFKIGETGVSFCFQPITDGEAAEPQALPKPVAPSVPTLLDSESKGLEVENEALHKEILNLRIQIKAQNSPPEEVEEISQVKRNALKEINTIKEAESRRFESWKRESVDEVERSMITMIGRRNKSKLSLDEINHDVSVALRKTLLGEENPISPYYRPADSHWKLMVSFVIVAALCCGGYVYHSNLNAPRKPAAVTYVPPQPRPAVQRPVAPTVAAKSSKASPKHSKTKR